MVIILKRETDCLQRDMNRNLTAYNQLRLHDKIRFKTPSSVRIKANKTVTISTVNYRILTASHNDQLSFCSLKVHVETEEKNAFQTFSFCYL